jgi:hypothetical protein
MLKVFLLLNQSEEKERVLMNLSSNHDVSNDFHMCEALDAQLD